LGQRGKPIKLAAAENFAGKLVMDTTNQLRLEVEGQSLLLDVGYTESTTLNAPAST